MTDSDMSTNREQDKEFKDPKFSRVLQEWQAPAIPGAMDARILAEYRAIAKKESLWWRFFFASIKIPVPVAIVLIMLVCLAAVFELRRPVVVKIVPAEYANPGAIPAAYREPPIVTHTSLDGFQPVADVNVTVSEEPQK
jgi:hypothetical protein